MRDDGLEDPNGCTDPLTGETVVMTGRFSYAGEAGVALSASVGVVEVDEDGGWTWQLASESRSSAGELVVISATADDKMSKVVFELIHPERRGD